MGSRKGRVMSDNAVVDVVDTQARVQVKVKVNRQDVVLRSRRVTGAQIKEAAIAQGVKIDMGFRLSRHVGGRWIPVRDDEPVEVHQGDQFRARTPDENS